MHKFATQSLFVLSEPFYYFTDIHPSTEDYSILSRMLAHYPGGTGWKNLLHLTQQINSEGEIMKKFDHGETRNLEIYGTKAAPLYDWENVRGVKISAYCGDKDFLEPPTAAKKSFDFMVNNQESIKFTI